MKILFDEEPKLKEAYDIVNSLRSIFRSMTLDKEAARVKIHDWYETATRWSLREINWPSGLKFYGVKRYFLYT